MPGLFRIRNVVSALVLSAAGCLQLQTFAQFGMGGAFGRTGSTTYPSATSIGSATFMSDPETRKLVVVTDEETAQYIGQVVTNLDRRPPQVLIKVVFMEVTYKKDLDLGLEGGISKP
ncbi:MAG: hypothetical protein N3G20_09465, partial [Verrucomicrobiae bacterium]|nr:hypothetical protein [Verrucomicrobiae bacterium]